MLFLMARSLEAINVVMKKQKKINKKETKVNHDSRVD